jgi:hypothetical protein
MSDQEPNVTHKTVNPREHNVVQYILRALAVLETEGDSLEDGRSKAMVKTHLEDALLRSGCIYEPIRLEFADLEDGALPMTVEEEEKQNESN